MTRTKKDTRKRRVGYVLGSLDRSMGHCSVIKSEFDKALKLDPMSDTYTEKLGTLLPDSQHAKLAYLLYASMMMMLKAQSLVEQFAVTAYGKVPDKVERWTQTGYDHRKKREREAQETPESAS